MIIDAHVHVNEDRCGVPTFERGTDIWMKYQPKVNCDMLIHCADERYEHIQEAIDKYEKYDGKIRSMFRFEATRAEECIAWMNQYCDHPAFVGIKLHPPVEKVAADDERFRAVWEWADKHNFPIMSHTWAATNPSQATATPDKFEKYLKDYPKVNFVFGHAGGRTRGIIEAVELGKKYKNAYYDLAGDVYNRKLIEYICQNVGADHLMVGSDLPWFDLAVPTGMVLGADITEEEKLLILGGTAEKLFHKR
ncbi:MAG: amidohydrolase family protein [Clostridia bacterium]|nr:amidohydrolase family protein [Clostridia bacterium]